MLGSMPATISTLYRSTIVFIILLSPRPLRATSQVFFRGCGDCRVREQPGLAAVHTPRAHGSSPRRGRNNTRCEVSHASHQHKVEAVRPGAAVDCSVACAFPVVQASLLPLVLAVGVAVANSAHRPNVLPVLAAVRSFDCISAHHQRKKEAARRTSSFDSHPILAPAK